MEDLPESVQRAVNKQAPFEVPVDMRMDPTRGRDAVHPPLRILTWRGQYAETGWQEEPELRQKWDSFIAKIAAFERAANDRGEDSEVPVHKTICFEQDGFSFDADGVIVREVMDFAAQLRARKRLAQAEAARIGQEAMRKAMVEAGFSDSAHFAMPVALPDSADARPSPTDVIARARDGHHHQNLDRPHAGKPADHIDLAAWARGELRDVHFFTIKKAFRDQQNINIKDAAHGRQWLGENGHIPLIAS